MNLPSPAKISSLEQRMASLGIDPADLMEKFVRGSGAGGQKVNKTSNCVFLKHLPSGIAIKCQLERSREMNRFLARRELCDQMDGIINGKLSTKTQAIEKLRRQKRQRSRRSKQRSVAGKRILPESSTNPETKRFGTGSTIPNDCIPAAFPPTSPRAVTHP